MNSQYSKLISTIPVRPRVAFTLAVAERVKPALEGNTEAFNAVQKALADSWRWEQGKDIKALQLYDNDDEALALQGCLVKDKEGSNALMTATSAFYFTLRHAYIIDLRKGLVQEGEVPCMTEVTEQELIDEACKCATQTSLCDSHWITTMVDRLLNDFQTKNPDELGPVVSPQYFK